MKEMVLELLMSMDDKTLAQANSRADDFKDAISICSVKYGASWADIVIHFEWREELEKIASDKSLSEQ